MDFQKKLSEESPEDSARINRIMVFMVAKMSNLTGLNGFKTTSKGQIYTHNSLNTKQ